MTSGGLLHSPNSRLPGINAILDNLLRNRFPLFLQNISESFETVDESILVQTLLE